MTSRSSHDPMYDLQEQINKLRKKINDISNRKQTILPIWDAATIPTTFPDGVRGQLVCGDDDVPYIWKDSAWTPIGGGSSSGGITTITSTDSSIVVTNATGPTTDLSVPTLYAVDIPFAPTTNISSVNVQAALAELDTDLRALIAALTATNIIFTPTTNIAATNTQAAIAELDTDLRTLISAIPSVIEVFTLPGLLGAVNGLSRGTAPANGTITSIHISVGTSPTGSSLIARLNKNGSSLGTGTISAGANTGTLSPSSSSFSTGDYFTVDLTQVGSSTPGTDFVLKIWGKYS